VTVTDHRDLVTALLGVTGVADASVEPDEDAQGPGVLRLQLEPGADEVAVAADVNRLLRSQFGLAVDADRVRVLETSVPATGRGPAGPRPADPAPTAGRPGGLQPGGWPSSPAPEPADAGPAARAPEPADAGPAARAPEPADAGPAARAPEPAEAPRPAPAAAAGHAAQPDDNVQPTDAPDPADPADRADSGGPVTTADPTGRPPGTTLPEVQVARAGRLAIQRVQLVSAGLGIVVTVTLRLDARLYSGEAEGAATTSSVHRSVAGATLRAVEEVAARRIRFEVEHVEIATTGTHRTALVVVTMLTARGSERLSGASVVREDVRQAVIRAVLAAVNRRLEPMLDG
jgi:hypothetical protein